MKPTATIFTTAAAIWLAGIGTGAAQDVRPPQAAIDGLPPYEIITIIRSLGFNPIGRPVRQGPAYVLHAVDRYDREIRVVVDARSGRVQSTVPVIPAGAWRQGPGPGAWREGRPYSRDPSFDPRDSYYGRPPLPGGTYEDADEERSLPPPGTDPRVIRAPQGVDRQGALPPPPPPPRAGTPSDPSIARSVATPPTRTPVPRPRPAALASTSATPEQPVPAENPDKSAEPAKKPDKSPEPAKTPEAPGVPVNPPW
ncbi:MAG: hypothetical protein HY659_12885 [Rhizobiales bacterium]|nr:hypothetical protein [Hyphomicrobiales bacterium]